MTINGAVFGKIASAVDFSAEEKQLLYAAHMAFVDEFHDVSFDELPVISQPAERNVVDFFTSCVRHHWAKLVKDPTSSNCTFTDAAIRCPFSGAQIVLLIQRFEREVGPLYTPYRKAKPCQAQRSLTA